QQRRTSDMSAEERALTVAGRFAGPDAPASAAWAPHTTAVAMRGEQVFQSNCAACHSLASTRSVAGPTLNGVIGRRVGSADFGYSDALSRTSDVWTSRRIVDFAVRPGSEHAGTSMPPVALTPADQRDLEQYLDTTPLQSRRG